MSVQLVSSEGKTIVVQRNILTQSELLTNMLEDLGYEDGQDVPDLVPLPKVTTEILQKIIQWCTNHKDDAPYVEKEFPDEQDKEMTAWEEQYFKDLGQVDLFEIIQAANYMSVRRLLQKSCVFVANMLVGKEPEAIRQMFNIENDFTLEEQAEAKTRSNGTMKFT